MLGRSFGGSGLCGGLGGGWDWRWVGSEWELDGMLKRASSVSYEDMRI